MKRIVTSAQAKEIDRYSIEELGMPGIVLMERAAMRFTERFLEYVDDKLSPCRGWRGRRDGTDAGWKASACIGKRVMVVCGSGNNGGDGMAVARMLFEKGFDCSVYLAGNPERMTESARVQWRLLKNLGVMLLSEFAPEPGTWIVDALFGVGLSREVTGDYAKLIEKMNEFRCFAVDLPSGLNADNGQAMAVRADGKGMTAVKAEMTVTFGPVKAGLVLGNGRTYAGKVYAEDIGFPQKSVRRMHSGYYLTDEDITKMLPMRREDSNKGTYGRLLVFAGSETMIGAAYYAGLAAYRIGAGLVEIVTNRQNLPVLAGMLPAAVYTKAETFFLPEDTKSLEKKIDAASSVVLGPGLGQSEMAETIVKEVLKICSRKKKPLVIDADGLNLLAKHKEWYDFFYSGIVLTPHLKEMSRLSGLEVSQIKGNMITAAMDFSSHYGAVMVLKDSRSVITDGEDYWINLSGNHGMAVGGSGDILSGILGGLLAQTARKDAGTEKRQCLSESSPQEEKTVLEMAALAAYLHGRAGDAAREQSNAYSMTGEDILEGLKQILKAADGKCRQSGSNESA